MKANTQTAQTVINRKLLLAFFILVSIITSLVLGGRRAYASSNRPIYSYCTSYEIQPGDTLWTISDKFIGPDYPDKRTFINNIKRLNHLGTDNITAGQYLIIEYYSYEQL